MLNFHEAYRKQLLDNIVHSSWAPGFLLLYQLRFWEAPSVSDETLSSAYTMMAVNGDETLMALVFEKYADRLRWYPDSMATDHLRSFVNRQPLKISNAWPEKIKKDWSARKPEAFVNCLVLLFRAFGTSDKDTLNVFLETFLGETISVNSRSLFSLLLDLNKTHKWFDPMACLDVIKARNAFSFGSILFATQDISLVPSNAVDLFWEERWMDHTEQKQL